MSFHNTPKYNTPEIQDQLKKHGLPTDTPSQLADCFRCGYVAARPMTVAEAAKVLLDHHKEKRVLSSPKVRTAMCDFTQDTTGRMPFPVSFWDGPIIAALRALSQGGE